nr:hypothetical transcript [Hymenolepis microstoma]
MYLLSVTGQEKTTEPAVNIHILWLLPFEYGAIVVENLSSNFGCFLRFGITISPPIVWIAVFILESEESYKVFHTYQISHKREEMIIRQTAFFCKPHLTEVEIKDSSRCVQSRRT